MFDDLEITDTIVFKFLYEHGELAPRRAYELATRILDVIPESHDYWPAVALLQRNYQYQAPSTLEVVAVEVESSTGRHSEMPDSFIAGGNLMRVEQALTQNKWRYVCTGEQVEVQPVPIPSTRLVLGLRDLEINWRGNGWYPTEDGQQWRLIIQGRDGYLVQTFESDPRERLGALAAAPVLQSESL